MTAKYYEWLSTQIEQHAKIETVAQGYDHTALTRLADAAGALQSRAPGAQAFGMTLPAGGVEGAQVLVDRCLAIIEQRSALLDADTRDQLAGLLGRLELKQVIGAPKPVATSHQLRISLPVVVEDPVSEDELVDPAAKRRLNGAREQSGTLIDVPCIQQAVGGWASDAHARLAFDAGAGALLGQLIFAVTRPPSEEELGTLLECVGTELFDTSWILNLDWALPAGAPDVIVHLQPKILSYELVPVAAG